MVDQNKQLVIVGTEWCGMCKSLKKALEDCSQRLQNFKIKHLDGDHMRSDDGPFTIDAYPTIMLFKKDTSCNCWIYQDKQVGFYSQKELIEWIEQYE